MKPRYVAIVLSFFMGAPWGWGQDLSFTAKGEPWAIAHPGYVHQVYDDLGPYLSVFTDYDDRFRPLDVTVTPGTLLGVPGLEQATVLQIVSHLSPRAVKNLVNYGQNMALFYKVPKGEGISLFLLKDGRLSLAQDMPASKIQNSRAPLAPAINLMQGVPGTTVIFPPLLIVRDTDSDRVWAALLNPHVQRTLIPAEGLRPEMDHENAISPANTWGSVPEVPLLVDSEGRVSAAWGEKDKIRVLALNKDLQQTQELTLDADWPLFGGWARDNSGKLYAVQAKRNKDGDFSSNVKVVQYDENGRPLKTFYLPTDNTKGYDVMDPIIPDATSRIIWAGGKLCVHLGKTQHKNKADGANHQSGIVFTLDAETMKLIPEQSATWTGSHSFDQRILFDGTHFVLADMCDNFPRGIRLSQAGGDGRVVFTYKTHYGATAAKRGHKVLKPGFWSNDTLTYTELGGLAESDHGYLVLGSSEKSFENADAKTDLNDSRNLFFVQVVKDFLSVPKIQRDGKDQECIVSEPLVLSRGESSPEIYFYDYGGGKNYQRRVGVDWLTDYHDVKKTNAVKPKLVPLGGGRYVALWEQWTDREYITTWYLVFRQDGSVETPMTDLGPCRLSRADEPVLSNGIVVWAFPEPTRGRVAIYRLTP